MFKLRVYLPVAEAVTDGVSCVDHPGVSLQVIEDLQAKLQQAEKGALVAQSQAEQLSAAENKVHPSPLVPPSHSGSSVP